MNQPVLPLAYVYAMSLVGWPLVAAMLALVEAPPSAVPAMALRLSVAGVAAFALLRWRGALVVRRPDFLLAFLVFWSAYPLRLGWDVFIAQQFSAFLDPTLVFVYLVTFTLLPSAGMLFGMERRALEVTHRLVYWATCIAALVLLYQSTAIILRLLEQKSAIRFEFERLGPIGVGLLGAMLLLLAAVGLTRAVERGRPLRALANLGWFALGTYIVLIAASKGPAASAALALLAYWLVPLRPARAVTGVLLCAGLWFGVSMLQQTLLTSFDFDVFQRFVEVLDGESTSVDGRSEMYTGAWSQFLESPVFGDAFVERTSQYYPHNLVLEAFMATGIVGGAAYLWMLASAFLAGLRLLAANRGCEWLVLLGYANMLSGMFSGAHFSHSSHWVGLVALVMTEAALRDPVGVQGLEGRRRRRSGGSGVRARFRQWQAARYAPRLRPTR